MTTQLSIDRDRTALLVMDYQNDIVGSVSASERPGLLHRASSVVAATRKAGIPVVYVVVSFRPGHPEVSTRNKSFSAMKSTGRLREGTPGAEEVPLPHEIREGRRTHARRQRFVGGIAVDQARAGRVRHLAARPRLPEWRTRTAPARWPDSGSGCGSARG